MCVLLSDIAISITQNSLENLQKGMELPGRVKHILETDTKPLIDQDDFDLFLENKKTETRKRRVKPFCKRQEVSVSCEITSSNVATTQNTSAFSTPAPNNRLQKIQKKFRGRGRGRGSREGNIGAASKARNRGIKSTNSGLLRSSFHDPEEGWRPKSSTGPEGTQSTRRETEFQNGNPEIAMLHDTQEGLSQFFRTTRCIYANPGIQEVQEIPPIPMEQSFIEIQGPSFWDFTQLFNLYQDTMASFRIKQVQGNVVFSLSQALLENIEQFDCPSPSETDATPFIRAEESVHEEYEIMDISRCSNGAGSP
ncbi:hypothetical protein AYI68_g3113 [Smittium mucronatum]|uniref:Uncharacterized protein n=1 Tax=Smittium mucronatum TaxID=133383 RepID=A0A1R0H0V1_9FUNG|nr:hypothetical protein AYI68_g3113 [Smittium mucronatum]